MHPHYFGVSSRLGLQYPPIGATEANLGVEDGPAAVITTDFLQQNPGALDSYHFPTPEHIQENYWQTVLQYSTETAYLMWAMLQSAETQIVIGGDHSVTFASLLALSARVPLPEVAYIQIDSHADINTLATSPSGNFHGMYLRAAIDGIGVPAIDQALSSKLAPQQMMYIGNLSFDQDPEERNFITTHQVPVISVAAVRNSQEATCMKIQALVSRCAHTHISFDIDAMDASIAPATGIPCRDGFLLEDVLPLISCIQKYSSTVSFDLVEVNPHKTGADQTIETAQRILSEFTHERKLEADT